MATDVTPLKMCHLDSLPAVHDLLYPTWEGACETYCTLRIDVADYLCTARDVK